MAEEALTAPVEENGAPVDESAAPSEAEAPASTPPEGYIDQQRYEELRREFNQRNNLIDRARQGDAEALRELTGFTFADDDEPDTDPDYEEQEDAPRDPRVDAILEERQREQFERFVEGVQGHIGSLLDEAKINLPDELKSGLLPAVFAAAGEGQPTPETTQQVVSQWTKAIGTIKQEAVKEYIASKRNAPFVNPGGTGATEVPNLDDGPTRRQWLMEQVAAAESQ